MSKTVFVLHTHEINLNAYDPVAMTYLEGVYSTKALATSAGIVAVFKDAKQYVEENPWQFDGYDDAELDDDGNLTESSANKLLAEHIGDVGYQRNVGYQLGDVEITFSVNEKTIDN